MPAYLLALFMQVQTAVVSLPKAVLTNFVGTLSPQKIQALNKALAIA
ncbi:MAG: hypothetical protein HY268_24930 [Deltaproteobacteria bacterium]|nr:hypothetical protein [Deltaproteobacteria bacterium]